jgi:hypothetical protein
MTMMGNLYCALVELGGGFDCQQDDDGVITYRDKATGRFVTISNAEGRFSVRLPDGNVQAVINDGKAADVIQGFLEED